MPHHLGKYRLSCRKSLIIICLVAIFINLVLFWPYVRSYADIVAKGYEVISNKDDQRHAPQQISPTSTSSFQSDSVPSKVGSDAIDSHEAKAVNPNNVIQMEAPDEVSKSEELGEPENELPPCPDIPPKLIGSLAGWTSDINVEEVLARHQAGSQDYTAMEKGGVSRPVNCRSPQKLAIIIPYRNRYNHLHILLNNLIPFLRRQQKDFRIFVIDQNPPTLFNRGMLFNVGFLEALKFEHFDCFVFHDVDMIPVNDHALYTCKDNPMHLAAWTDKWASGLPYKNYFGAVVMFSKDQFEKLNGDSNLYFGWGGEDDDLWMRVKAKGYRAIRYPQMIGRFKMIKHTRDHGNEAGNKRFTLLKNGKRRIDMDGLNSAIYEVTKVEEELLYTWIHVSIDQNQMVKVCESWNADGIVQETLLLEQS